jgi:hypothetical protein
MMASGCHISSYRYKTLQVLLAAFAVVSIILVIIQVIHQQSVGSISLELKGKLGLKLQEHGPSHSIKRFFNSQQRQYNLMEEITNNAKVSNNFGSKDCTIGDSFI